MNHDILTLTDVRKSFGDAQIIRGVNLAVRAGERHAVIGPNGAGKSTLFHLMSGSFAPTSGDISLQSRAIGGLAPERINRLGLARSFQITNVFPRLSVRENLRLAVLRMHGLVYTFWRPIARNRAVNEDVDRLLEKVRLAPRQHVAAGDLNYSEQRSLEIGMTLASRPRVILLDEPMAGMSQHEVDYTVELIKDVTRDCTLLIVEHDMQVVFSLADRISVLVYGEILATGTPAEIRGDARVREAYLGRKPYEPARHPSRRLQGEQQRAQREGRRDEHANRGTAQPSGRARPLWQEPHPAWHRPGHRPGRSHQPAGRNGAGRSTTMKSIMGLVDVTGGQIHIEGRDITNKRPFEIARAGLGFVPRNARSSPT